MDLGEYSSSIFRENIILALFFEIHTPDSEEMLVFSVEKVVHLVQEVNGAVSHTCIIAFFSNLG